jgi:hypothetical protein
MTTYTTPVAKIAGDPVTFEDWNAANDNPLAIAEGDPTAPAISPAALRWTVIEIFYDSSTASPITANGNGSFSFTVPAGVTAGLIEAVAGGGGGGGAGEDSDGTAGSAGGDTTFDGEVIAKGGGGGGAGTSGGGGAGGAAGLTSSSDADTGVSGLAGSAGTRTGSGAQAGGAGANREIEWTFFDGGNGSPNGSTGGTRGLDHGTGGGGGGADDAGGVKASGGGGGSSSWGRLVVPLTPTATYDIQIGKGGNGGAAGDSTAGGAGGEHLQGTNGSAGSDGGSGGGGGAGKMRIWYRKV